MEDRTVPIEDAEPEQISESFTCCVCLDLLYKPVILSCGHISCFWCVHKSMNHFGESQCPICRQPYLHFPKEEKRIETFSPQFDALAWRSGDEEEQKLTGSSQSHMTCLGPNSSMDTGSSRNGETSASKVQSEPVACIDGNGPSSPQQDLKRKHDIPVEEENGHLVGSNKSCKQITVSDALCAECKQLLFRPVALNCGHVYCEACIVNPADEKIKCQVCQSRHPWRLSEVCLELDHFLEEQFPEEYALRRSAARPRLAMSKNDSPKSRNNKGDNQQNNSSWSTDTAMIHIGVGCDYCGMYPIIGDRYQCQDCIEKIGFDLCGDCHNSHSKLPGRFNQQHQPEHKFKLIKLSPLENDMSRLVWGRLGGGSTALVLSNNSPEDGIVLTAPTSPSDVQEDAENSLAISFVLEDDAGSGHQNDSHSN